jgi:polyisoprenoid-binding protein YceI
MRNRLLTLLAFSLIAAAAIPASSPVFAQTSLNVPAATYTIDPKHTQILFSIRHMGLSTFFGRFGHVTGSLNFDPAAPEKSTLTAQIDMTNIQTHVDALDKELTSSFFHADKFPTATFVATRSEKTGANTGTVEGNLTIAGVTKPVTLNVTFNGGRNSPFPLQPYRIGFDATTMVKRSDFGLTHTMWSGMVSDDVTLWIECELEKK